MYKKNIEKYSSEDFLRSKNGIIVNHNLWLSLKIFWKRIVSILITAVPSRLNGNKQTSQHAIGTTKAEVAFQNREENWSAILKGSRECFWGWFWLSQSWFEVSQFTYAMLEVNEENQKMISIIL